MITKETRTPGASSSSSSSSKQLEKKGTAQGIQDFYFSTFGKLIYGFHRTKTTSVILLSTYYFQVLSLTFNAAYFTQYAFKKNGLTYEDLAFQSYQNGETSIRSQIILEGSDLTFQYYLYKLFSYSRVYPIFYDVFTQQTSSLNYFFSIFFLAINLTLLLYPLIKMITQLLDLEPITQLNALESRKKQSEDPYCEVTLIFNYLDPYYSFLYSIYRYVLAIPIVVHQFTMLVQSNVQAGIPPFAVINIIITGILMLVISIHDFSISFSSNNIFNKQSDCLSRSLSLQSLINALGIAIQCGITSVSTSISQFTYIAAISLGFSAVECIEFLRSQIFLNRDIAFLNFTLLSILVYFNGIVLLFGNTNLVNYMNCSLFLILTLPIVFTISYHSFNYFENHILKFSTQKLFKNASTLDLFARTLQNNSQNIDKKEYFLSQKGVEFEGLFLNHYESCQDHSCFCRQTQENLENSNLEKPQIRKKFIDLYLLFIYDAFLLRNKQQHSKLIQLYYLALLVDSVQCPIKANIQAISLKNSSWKNFSFREKIILNQLALKSKFLFQNVLMAAQKINSQFSGSGFYHSETDLYDIIRFDSLLTCFQKTTRTIYIDKRDFYNIIACEDVDLLEIKQKGENIIKNLDLVDSMINELNAINPLSRRSQELTLIYTSVFDMRKQRIKAFVSQQKKSIFYKILQGDERTLNFFSSKSCCLFMSLLHPVGIIKKCTKTISNLFKVSQSDVMNKSVNILIPRDIAVVHDNIINNFIKEGTTTKILSTSYLLFGKTKNNFIFPIDATMRLTHLGEDFGISCFIRQIEGSSNYILIDDKLTITGRRNKIVSMSQELYGICFSQVSSKDKFDDKLRSIDLYKMLPFLQGLDKAGCEELDSYQSILFYPQQPYHLDNLKKRIKMSKRNTADMAWFMIFCLASNCGILDVSFSVKSLTSKIGLRFKYIEIQSIRKIKRKSEKILAMQVLRSDLNEIMKLNINMEEEALLNSLETLRKNLKLSLSVKDLTSIFKNQINDVHGINKNETEETQQKMLSKRITLQSLSAKETMNAKSSRGGFDDEEDEEQNVDYEAIQEMKYKDLENKTKVELNKSKKIKESFVERSGFLFENQTFYGENDDASNINLKDKGGLNISSLSFKERFRERTQTNNLTYSLGGKTDQAIETMNINHTIMDLNTFHKNDTIQNEKDKKVITNKDNQQQLREPELLHQSYVDSQVDHNNLSKSNAHDYPYSNISDMNPYNRPNANLDLTNRSNLWGSATNRDLKGINSADLEMIPLQGASMEQQVQGVSFDNFQNLSMEQLQGAVSNNDKMRYVQQQQLQQQSQMNSRIIDASRQATLGIEENTVRKHLGYELNGKEQDYDNILLEGKHNGNNSPQIQGKHHSDETLVGNTEDPLKKKGISKHQISSNNMSTGNFSYQGIGQKETLQQGQSGNAFSFLSKSAQGQTSNVLSLQNIIPKDLLNQPNQPDEILTKQNDQTYDFQRQTKALTGIESSIMDKSIRQQMFFSGGESDKVAGQNSKKKKKKEKKNKNDENLKIIQAENNILNGMNSNEQIQLNKDNTNEVPKDEDKADTEDDDEDEEDDEEEEEINISNKKKESNTNDEFARKKSNKQKQDNLKAEGDNSFSSNAIEQQKIIDLELIDRLDTHGQSSSSRSKSDMGMRKQVMTAVMMNNFQGLLVNTIQFIGILAFAFLVTITCYVYSAISSNFTTMQINGEVIYLGPGLEENNSRVLSQNGMIKMSKLGILVNPLSTSEIANYRLNNDETVGEIMHKLSILSDTHLEFANVILEDQDPKVLSYFDAAGNELYQVSTTHLYSLMEAYLGLYNYIHLGDSISRLFLIKNYLDIVDIFTDLRNSANSTAQNSADSAKIVLMYTFAMIVAVAFFTIGLIFPIYSKVQSSKEESLKLFATFPRDKLETMIIQMERIINSNIFLRYSTEKETHLKSNIRWKKRTIASTNKLSRVNLIASIGCLIAFILISLYPLINYLINSTYITQLKAFLEELSYVHTARGHTAFAKSLAFTRIYSGLTNDVKISQLIDNYLPTLQDSNIEVMNQLKDVLNNFQDTSRYNYDIQKQYVLESLDSDMCQHFKFFQALNLSYESITSSDIDSAACYQTYGYLLPRGLIITVKEVLSIYDDIFTMTQSTNLSSQLQAWDISHNINLFDDLSVFISGAFESIALFQTSELANLFNFLQTLQIILLAYALIVIVLLFAVGWRKFVSYVHSEINRTKYLFSLFSIDALLDNNYIASYLKKSSKNL